MDCDEVNTEAQAEADADDDSEANAEEGRTASQAGRQGGLPGDSREAQTDDRRHG